MSGALGDLVVLDLTREVWGGLSAALLGDLLCGRKWRWANR